MVDPKVVDWTNYPLTLVAAFRDTLTLRVGYSLSRLDRRAVERMLGHLARAARRHRRGPRARRLRAADARRRGAAPAARGVERATGRPSGRRLRARARSRRRSTDARTPSRVVAGDRALTYRELDARANRLAHRLRRRGVGPDVLVGVCVERSMELVVALLAVLKAGGAYVPMDPSYPEDRVHHMLADARAPVLLTQARLAASCGPRTPCQSSAIAIKSIKI